LVFIDEGYMTPDAYAVYYQQAVWFDNPPVRHSDGVTVSFADGHVEKWRWREGNAIEVAQLNDWLVVKPAVAGSDRDLGRFFKAVPEKVPVP
jgi:prepilin-type processing-associated H-X9-DG protein